jgi:hypothetical protein
METLLVALSGRARHGKNYLAQLIHERLPRETQIYAFATALKTFCRVMGWMDVKDGRVLQLVGTDIFRNADQDVWVRCLHNQILEEKPQVALITDCRFPNEIDFVSRNGGMTIRVERYMSNGQLYLSGDRDPNHPSETALDNSEFDHVVKVQDGDLKELHFAADSFVKIIKRRLASAA